MSWLVTAKQYIPAVIGEEFGGGYFAGYISHTADGNPTHDHWTRHCHLGRHRSRYTMTHAQSCNSSSAAEVLQ
jgi:hypothetical protein